MLFSEFFSECSHSRKSGKVLARIEYYKKLHKVLYDRSLATEEAFKSKHHGYKYPKKYTVLDTVRILFRNSLKNQLTKD